MRLRMSILLLVSALVTMSLSRSIAVSQVKKGGAGPFQNLRILKPSEVDMQMNAYRSGLGADCAFCHMPADYATDDSPNKVVARQMIILTRDINAKYFSGSDQVTCYTCHRGALMPLMKAPTAR
jgi:Photosynthetic reaction centre cytochrome C subunit